MRRGRTFMISGTVVDAGGGPAPGATLHLSRFAVGRVTSSTVQVDANGGFTIRNVQPGEYAIQGSTPSAAAFVQVRVEDSDLDGMVVTLRNTVDVQGRFVPEDSSATLPPVPGSGLMIDARLRDEHLPGMGSRLITFARKDLTFTLEKVFGQRLLTFTNAPRGWYVKSVRYDGREIIDTATEFKGGAGAPTLEIVLGNRGASVTGTVVDDGGGPAAAIVYMLREKAAGGIDIAAWASTASGGAFTIGPERGGEYVLVAMPRSPSGEILSSSAQDRLARLAALRERLTLTDLDERTIQLHVVRDR
jgi:Carboxypeptidase regulatory-like domain